MTQIDYAHRTEALRLKRDVTPSAYQKGFEDARYPGAGGLRYRNPFPLGGHDWLDYDQGFGDAMRSCQEERI